MESKAERADEAQGLRLVRSFLNLSPERRQMVLDFVEELCRQQGRSDDGAEAPPR
jgi:hypothetical protein